ncbi:MAG TPA: hypothetical protein DEF41_10990 [Desulfovibrio sp.]|uniref:Uncharacterized protein n=1 Tax=Nitratidesulfovibrio vulgaris (strain ATCC 29579 / DSM 644 / CCUG 34227 / NCIMB 8303 / VKM B-1760 / Hildenborough) TaxID=882 RepID=Q729S5_NITV2|nr:hypothetical protein DVU_2274 [Nitratidesulfovibrio vulgaris str. Hildenborough]HBW16630.1 hypothetical protein [Desulfovibrio sp.]
MLLSRGIMGGPRTEGSWCGREGNLEDFFVKRKFFSQSIKNGRRRL